MTSPQSDLSARRARLRRDRIPIDKLGDLDAFELRRVTSAGMELLHRRPPRTTLSDVVREFAPNWFTVTMGTGALALALNRFPLPLPGVSDVAGGLWLLDLMLFVLFTVLYAARWILFFDGARKILRHSVVCAEN
jgi:Voltage-dependent anion channel